MKLHETWSNNTNLGGSGQLPRNPGICRIKSCRFSSSKVGVVCKFGTPGPMVLNIMFTIWNRQKLGKFHEIPRDSVIVSVISASFPCHLGAGPSGGALEKEKPAQWIFNTPAGWWFGTWILFSHSQLEFNHPNWLIFVRRVEPPTSLAWKESFNKPFFKWEKQGGALW